MGYRWAFGWMDCLWARNLVKLLKNPVKYGIPIIRTEKYRFCSGSDNLHPEFRTVSRFFQKNGNGQVKCGKMDGSVREKFRPFSTLAAEAWQGFRPSLVPSG